MREVNVLPLIASVGRNDWLDNVNLFSDARSVHRVRPFYTIPSVIKLGPVPNL